MNQPIQSAPVPVQSPLLKSTEKRQLKNVLFGDRSFAIRNETSMPVRFHYLVCKSAYHAQEMQAEAHLKLAGVGEGSAAASLKTEGNKKEVSSCWVGPMFVKNGYEIHPSLPGRSILICFEQADTGKSFTRPFDLRWEAKFSVREEHYDESDRYSNPRNSTKVILTPASPHRVEPQSPAKGECEHVNSDVSSARLHHYLRAAGSPEKDRSPRHREKGSVQHDANASAVYRPRDGSVQHDANASAVYRPRDRAVARVDEHGRARASLVQDSGKRTPSGIKMEFLDRAHLQTSYLRALSNADGETRARSPSPLSPADRESDSDLESHLSLLYDA